jgi:hypothetical protein
MRSPGWRPFITLSRIAALAACSWATAESSKESGFLPFFSAQKAMVLELDLERSFAVPWWKCSFGATTERAPAGLCDDHVESRRNEETLATFQQRAPRCPITWLAARAHRAVCMRRSAKPVCGYDESVSIRNFGNSFVHVAVREFYPRRAQDPRYLPSDLESPRPMMSEEMQSACGGTLSGGCCCVQVRQGPRTMPAIACSSLNTNRFLPPREFRCSEKPFRYV